MKTATVRELRNHYSRILRWVGSGEEVRVSRRGKIVAKVVPAETAAPGKTDWSQSAALSKSSWARKLSSAESKSVLADSQG
jgi:prevent-host-death family protein